MYPQTKLQTGDVAHLIGAAEDVEEAAKKSVTPWFRQNGGLRLSGPGLLVGILVGMISLPMAGVPVGTGYRWRLPDFGA